MVGEAGEEERGRHRRPPALGVRAERADDALGQELGVRRARVVEAGREDDQVEGALGAILEDGAALGEARDRRRDDVDLAAADQVVGPEVLDGRFVLLDRLLTGPGRLQAEAYFSMSE